MLKSQAVHWEFPYTEAIENASAHPPVGKYWVLVNVVWRTALNRNPFIGRDYDLPSGGSTVIHEPLQPTSEVANTWQGTRYIPSRGQHSNEDRIYLPVESDNDFMIITYFEFDNN